MPELSITHLENRVSLVGDVITRGERDQLVDAIDAVLRELGPEQVILDVTRAGYVDSRALMTLVTAARRCLDAGAQLVLEGASEELQAQLQMTGIDRLLGARGVELQQPDNTDGTGAAA